MLEKQLETPITILKKYYGYNSFRKNQLEIITAILNKTDTLCIMPTGGGKSVCYQVPAMLFEGITVVISPLISLMKDQVDTLNSIGVPAIYLNSTVSHADQGEIMNDIKHGSYKLVYVSPERLDSNQFLQFLQQLPIDLIAVDEAHCISQWGHDFRPSYARIGHLMQQLSSKPVIAAFTATATKTVAQDIKQGLMLQSPLDFVSGYERENLAFSVVKTGNKRKYILEFIERLKGESGIIYTATRKDVEELQPFLEKNGVQAVTYHGGMSEKIRNENQEKFIYDDEKIIIATNAFGMGIDKSNVRYVVHYQLPKSMEAYYQEAGRAGRDGENSECVLLYTSKDVQTQKYLIEQNASDLERKDHEYSKLQAMVDYCHTTKCLQTYIVNYFGDVAENDCSKCSNCKSDLEEIDVTTEALKIFSCIVRMKERFGVTLVAQVLKGSNNKRIKELRLNELKTYGIMKEKTEKEISELTQLFIAEGYLALTTGQYPTVRLTERAASVLKDGERVVQKVKPVKKEEPIHSELFEELRQLRKEIAEKEKLPPYIVFSDVTLKEMCKYYPKTKADMLQIKGVGEMKFEKYGEAFLTAISAFSNENITIEMAPKVQEKPIEKAEDPSYLVTLQFFKDGMDIHEIALERDLKQTTVEQHLIQGAIEGIELEWERVLPNSYLQLINEKRAEIGGEKLKPLKEALPEEISYFHIKLALCK
ncbi:DNA helicase RecQ [Anaerobacillus isosaccharinicus]|uniref:DNA helicase RecQ n=1 Tax=Anaerobacillus isosaccharinicus TaxID=1532552 RepID=A0A1S2LGS2_9BACI|nr:DNA helicase RecQ [Anaerobacillus isosaccharinicus]MBA5585970.1 DNA helicase RecQ [Anaerobacillus isosaccharinicus]QOY35749.1 DNA helicase RecQ [Anaerobacillus isosaccharinicus]